MKVSNRRITAVLKDIASVALILVIAAGIVFGGVKLVHSIATYEPVLNPYGGKNSMDHEGGYYIVEVQDKDDVILCSYPVDPQADIKKMDCPEKYENKIFTDRGFVELGG